MADGPLLVRQEKTRKAEKEWYTVWESSRLQEQVKVDDRNSCRCNDNPTDPNEEVNLSSFRSQNKRPLFGVPDNSRRSGNCPGNTGFRKERDDLRQSIETVFSSKERDLNEVGVFKGNL